MKDKLTFFIVKDIAMLLQHFRYNFSCLFRHFTCLLWYFSFLFCYFNCLIRLFILIYQLFILVFQLFILKIQLFVLIFQLFILVQLTFFILKDIAVLLIHHDAFVTLFGFLDEEFFTARIGSGTMAFAAYRSGINFDVWPNRGLKPNAFPLRGKLTTWKKED